MILLGLGSNLGDRKANLEAALAALGQGDDAPLRLQRVSSVYESAALLPEGAPDEWDIPYYNIVVAAEGEMTPEALLDAVKTIEQQLGRKDVGRWGPRLIDIDILAHGDHICQQPKLVLPHPGMLERDFVMLPLAEIAPHWLCAQLEAATFTAHEWVTYKGMALGAGLMRTQVRLQWKTH